MKRVFLKKGREKSLLLRHPWVFSGAIENIQDSIDDGELVGIFDSKKNFLAKGHYSSKSQIALRVFDWDADSLPEDAMIVERLKRAFQFRAKYIDTSLTNCFRICNSEGDFLPGLIVDKYSDTLVIQINSAGMDRVRNIILESLNTLFSPKCVYERGDSDTRLKEGLKKIKGVSLGNYLDRVNVSENSIKFLVDIENGQKTGFFLDQRENRFELTHFSKGASILNCFSYTGGFSLYALKYGADDVLNVDTSPNALDLAKEISDINDIPSGKQNFLEADVFEFLRECKKSGKQFDIVILDPPKFVKNQLELKKGIRGYKDINMLAMQLVRKGGFLFTFSCSGHVDKELFCKIATWSAMDAKRDIRVIKWLGLPLDHPFLASLYESEYLKGLILQVL